MNYFTACRVNSPRLATPSTLSTAGGKEGEERKKMKTPSFRRREGAGGELNMQADGYELLYRLQSQLTPTRYAVDPLFASRKEGEKILGF